jgi:glycosyltransferase involved in cell wall biosynthesis
MRRASVSVTPQGGRRRRLHRPEVATLVSGLSAGSISNIGASLTYGFGMLGVDAELLVIREPAEDRRKRYAGIRFRSLGSRRTATSVLALARYLREVRPHTLLAQSATNNVLAIAAATVAHSRTTVVITEQTNLSLATTRATADNARMRLLPPLVKVTYPRADGLVSVSERALTDPLLARFVPRVPHAVIGNPVTWDIAARVLDGEPHPWLADPSANGRILVAVGRLLRGKGFDLLLCSVARLRERGIEVRLIIFGDGEERAELERLRHDLDLIGAVDLPGATGNPYPTLATADVFVLPSSVEGSSIALLEAMALGRPIVATEAGGATAEAVEDSRTALIVPDGDLDALTNALTNVLTSRSLADRLGSAARQASDHRRPESVAQRYIDFFETIRRKERTCRL